MLATATLSERHAALVAEREAAMTRYLRTDRQCAEALAQIEAERDRLLLQRQASATNHLKQDYGYAAVIGEIERMLALAEEDDRAADLPPATR
jgi:hypothetical protein